jgi:hypothetical protein
LTPITGSALLASNRFSGGAGLIPPQTVLKQRSTYQSMPESGGTVKIGAEARSSKRAGTIESDRLGEHVGGMPEDRVQSLAPFRG